MEEKTLIRGTFKKMNIPAFVSLALTILFLAQYVDQATSRWSASDEVAMFLMLTVLFAVLTFIFFFWMSGCSITVTNKRVYGTGAFRKRVDLPLDMISSVSSGAFSSIAVATSSGKIAFWFVANKDEVFKTITGCLLQRQDRACAQADTKPAASTSKVGELKEYKELLDMGAISQEEYDAKKKQLLDL